MLSAVAYVPIITTLVGLAFATELWKHWRRKPAATYLLWWFLGIATYVAGTVTESLTALLGWHAAIFRAWYITGALLGAAPLAQGSVYLLLPKRVANAMAVLFVSTVLVASTFVILSPLNLAHESVAAGRLTGRVLEWAWVRRFSPFLNSYAALFLIGGAVYSALKYRAVPNAEGRVRGNWLIAIGTLLPGIGGTATRYGHTEVLFVTELIGLLLVWWGYRTIVSDGGRSIHRAQQAVVG